MTSSLFEVASFENLASGSPVVNKSNFREQGILMSKEKGSRRRHGRKASCPEGKLDSEDVKSGVSSRDVFYFVLRYRDGKDQEVYEDSGKDEVTQRKTDISTIDAVQSEPGIFDPCIGHWQLITGYGRVRERGRGRERERGGRGERERGRERERGTEGEGEGEGVPSVPFFSNNLCTDSSRDGNATEEACGGKTETPRRPLGR